VLRLSDQQNQEDCHATHPVNRFGWPSSCHNDRHGTQPSSNDQRQE
jgi:hypothetical protein